MFPGLHFNMPDLKKARRKKVSKCKKSKWKVKQELTLTTWFYVLGADVPNCLKNYLSNDPQLEWLIRYISFISTIDFYICFIILLSNVIILIVFWNTFTHNTSSYLFLIYNVNNQYHWSEDRMLLEKCWPLTIWSWMSSIIICNSGNFTSQRRQWKTTNNTVLLMCSEWTLDNSWISL